MEAQALEAQSERSRTGLLSLRKGLKTGEEGLEPGEEVDESGENARAQPGTGDRAELRLTEGKQV